MSEMIERVARVMAADAWDFEKTPLSCAMYVDRYWKGYETPARNAIEAMREPTTVMIEAGCDYDERHLNLRLGRPPTPEECQADEWATMIDAALAE